MGGCGFGLQRTLTPCNGSLVLWGSRCHSGIRNASCRLWPDQGVAPATGASASVGCYREPATFLQYAEHVRASFQAQFLAFHGEPGRTIPEFFRYAKDIIPRGYGIVWRARRQAILDYSKLLREKQLLKREASSIAVVSMSPEDQKKYAAAFENVAPPFYARTRNDRFVIPVMTLIFFGLTLLSPPEALMPAKETTQAITTSTVPENSVQPVAASQEKPVSEPAERRFPDTTGKKLEVGTESLNGHNGHSGATQ